MEITIFSIIIPHDFVAESVVFPSMIQFLYSLDSGYESSSGNISPVNIPSYISLIYSILPLSSEVTSCPLCIFCSVCIATSTNAIVISSASPVCSVVKLFIAVTRLSLILSSFWNPLEFIVDSYDLRLFNVTEIASRSIENHTECAFPYSMNISVCSPLSVPLSIINSCPTSVSTPSMLSYCLWFTISF